MATIKDPSRRIADLLHKASVAIDNAARLTESARKAKIPMDLGRIMEAEHSLRQILANVERMR